MATQVQLRRGTSAQNDAFTGATGELTYDTTNKRVRVHDGGTAGGFEIKTEDGSGNTIFADNEKAIFGAGSDLEIFHNGSHSIISEGGTGNLRLQGNNLALETSGGTSYLTATNNGAVSAFYAGSQKLATTSTGIEVTDTVNNTPTINIKSSDTVVVADDVVGAITFEESDATGGTGVQAFIKAIANDSGNTYDMSIGVGGNTEAIRIDQSGNVGIGDDSPDMTTVIAYSDSGTDFNANDFTGGLGIYNTDDTNNTSSAINFKGGSRHDVLRIGAVRTSNSTSTSSNSADFVVSTRHLASSLGERFRITSNGSVGIGTSSPDQLLHVKSSGNTRAKIEAGTTSSFGQLYLGTENQFLIGYGSTHANEPNHIGLRNANASGEIFFVTGGSTERMRIDSAGHVTMPNQPAFCATATATDNLASSSTVPFGTERFDQNNDFSSNTFTAPVTGKYQLSYMVRMDNVDQASSYTRMSLITSNRGYESAIFDTSKLSGDPVYWHFTQSVLVDMDAGDTAYVKWTYSSGAQQADLNNGEFSGYLVA